MANEMIQPYTGPQTIDVTALAPSIVDAAPGALRGVRREQPGIDGVVSELDSAIPVVGAKAAISPDVYASFKKNHDLVVKLRAMRLVVDKLAEVLAESEAYYEDQRETDISLMAAAVKTSARQKDPSVRASFQKTLAYNTQIAMKAVKTRRKNAEGKEPSDKGGPGSKVGSPTGGAAPPAGSGPAMP